MKCILNGQLWDIITTSEGSGMNGCDQYLLKDGERIRLAACGKCKVVGSSEGKFLIESQPGSKQDE